MSPVLRALACAALLGLLSVPEVHAIDPATLPDPALQIRYQRLIHEFRCMQCQNETLADSPVDLAGDMRREVREMLLAGKSDQDIRDFMVGRYGDFILFKPRFAWKTAWLWSAPFVLLLAGGVIAARVLRQRARLVDDEPDEIIPP